MNALELPQGITAESVNGLPAYRVDTPTAQGLVYLNGAHVASWRPLGGHDVLWLSEESRFQAGTAIRGGVPICFPWFGPGRDGRHQPAHGFARLVTWRLVEANLEGGVAHLALELRGADAARELGGLPGGFTEAFTARYDVRMGERLDLALTVQAADAPLDFEEALHSYFSVSDVKQATVLGLEGTRYLDKVGGGESTQHGPVEFTEETDRIYLSPATTTVVDPGLDRRIIVEKSNSDQTVVWNPWVAKSRAMADFGDDEWPGMCCVETVNCLDSAVRLAPGGSHTMSATIRLG